MKIPKALLLFLVIAASIAFYLFGGEKLSTKEEWQKYSIVGLHTYIEITWEGTTNGTKNIKRQLDSIVLDFDALFTETDSSHPLNVLSRSPLGTTQVLSGEIKHLFDFLMQCKDLHQDYPAFQLGTAEWLVKYNLLDGATAESPYSKDSLISILSGDVYNYNPETGDLSLK